MSAWISAHIGCVIALIVFGGLCMLIGLAFAGRMQCEHKLTPAERRRLRDWLYDDTL